MSNSISINFAQAAHLPDVASVTDGTSNTVMFGEAIARGGASFDLRTLPLGATVLLHGDFSSFDMN